MLQLRVMEKKRELVRRVDVDELIDQIAGTVLTHLSSCRPGVRATWWSGATSTRS